MKNTLVIFVKTSEESPVITLVKEIDFIPSVGLEVEGGQISVVAYSNGEYRAAINKLQEVSEESFKSLLASGFKDLSKVDEPIKVEKTKTTEPEVSK